MAQIASNKKGRCEISFLIAPSDTALLNVFSYTSSGVLSIVAAAPLQPFIAGVTQLIQISADSVK